MRTLPPVLALALLLAGGGADAHESKAGPITVVHPWARPAAAGNGAAYFSVENAGPAADRLVAVASDVARTAGMHSTTIDAQGVGRMVPVQAVELPPGAGASFAPGGLHVMLVGLARPLRAGESFPLTLTFEQAGEVTVTVEVERSPSHGGGGGDAQEHGHTAP